MKEIREIALKFSQHDFMYKALCMEQEYKRERHAGIYSPHLSRFSFSFLFKINLEKRKKAFNIQSSNEILAAIEKAPSQYSEISFLQAALKAKMSERKRDSLNLDSV